MLKETEKLMMEAYNIKPHVFELYKQALNDVEEQFKIYDEIREYNQLKVLNAFQEERISDMHFTNSSGYGYDDIGRDTLDKVYARIFNTESALVRPHFVNGTHAIGCALMGNLRTNDTMLCITGTPYDTLHNIIGISGKDNIGSLREYGVNYKQVDLKDGTFDKESIINVLKEDPSIKLVHIQRSTGYGWRKSFLVSEIGEIISVIKEIRSDVCVFVDNCYGELVETKEPGDIGADIVVGSLMKNLGGGIAPTGGYVAGKKDLVYEVAQRLTAPGIGKDLGANFNLNNAFFKGVFMAPNAVKNALKTAIFTSYMIEKLGYEHVSPRYNEKRTDLIQTLDLHSKEKLVNFTQGIQSSSPIDSFVRVLPAPMPGYPFDEVMASGSFTQGSTIELSADAPVKEPYTLYMQGGLSIEYGKLSILLALTQMKNK